jgi:hypothetical protein
VITIRIGKFGLQTILRLDAGDSNDFVYFPAMLYGIDQGDYLQQCARDQQRLPRMVLSNLYLPNLDGGLPLLTSLKEPASLFGTYPS